MVGKARSPAINLRFGARHYGGNVTWDGCHEKREYSSVSTKVNSELPNDPAISLGMATCTHTHTHLDRILRETCTPVFIARYFHNSQKVQAAQCPSKDEWLNKIF